MGFMVKDDEEMSGINRIVGSTCYNSPSVFSEDVHVINQSRTTMIR